MTTEIKHFCHEFDSFKWYPSVQRLQNSFEDVLPRFKRVAGALPDCFHDKTLQADLKNLTESFESGLQINVYGEADLSVGDFATLSKEGEDKKKTARSEKQSPRMDEQTEQMFGKAQQRDTTGIKTQKVSLNIFVINNEIHETLEELIDISLLGLKSDGSKQDFTTFVLVKYDNRGDKGTEISEMLARAKLDQCMVAFGCEELKHKICCHIESMIVHALMRMSLYLRKYEQISNNPFLKCDLDILRDENVSRAISDFLRSENVFLDLRSDVSETTLKTRMVIATANSAVNEHERELDEMVDVGLKSLMRIIRCVSAEEFAKKLSLPVPFCNSLLCEVDFEEALMHSVSKNSRYHFKNRCRQATAKQESNVKKPFKFKFIVYSLQDDMDKVFQKAEKVLKSFQPISSIMKKMNHEIFDYLIQTEVEDAKNFTRKVSQAPTLDIKLRQELLSIDGVYGVGTMYGQLEIHIDKEDVAKQDKQKKEKLSDIAETVTETQTQEKQSNNTKTYAKNISEEIAAKMKSQGFFYPYSLRYVLRKPIPLCFKAEPGNTIRNSREQTGTLGGFCEITNDFSGLTCAHVVGESSGNVKEKLEIHIDGRFQLFSESQNVHCRTKDPNFPLIDKAVLNLNNEKECKERIKSEIFRFDKIKLTNSGCKISEGRRVHKFGAATGFTKGLVASSAYSSRDNKQSLETYIYIIDPVPDWKEGNRLKLKSLMINDSQEHSEPTVEDDTEPQASNITTDYERMPDSIKESNVVPCCALHRDEIKQNHQAARAYSKEDISMSAKKSDSDTENQTESEAIVKEHQLSKCISKSVCCKTNSEISLTEESDSLKMIVKEICGNLEVYVRSIFSVEDKDHCKDLVFGKEGDSGSVICMQDDKNRASYTALSMLSAGVLKIEGHCGKPCFSFNLRLGLELLIKQMLQQRQRQV